MIVGPLGAIAETNLRRVIGFPLIGGIGVILAGMALGDAGLAGALPYVVHSMLTMTALYLVAGLIEALTGETDTRRMGGLYAAASLPLDAVLRADPRDRRRAAVPRLLAEAAAARGGDRADADGADGWALAL